MYTRVNDQSDYKDTTNHYHNFEKFDNGEKNLLYAYGIYSGFCENDVISSLGYKNNIYFFAEEPNGLAAGGLLPHERGRYVLDINVWDVIYMQCPYTTKWYNQIYNTDKFKLLHNLPMVDNQYLPDLSEDKEYDIFFQGGNHSPEINATLDYMSTKKYIWTNIHSRPDSRITHFKVPYTEKLRLLAKSKITVEFNTVYESYRGHYSKSVRNYPNWKDNEAFKCVDDIGIVPQFKTRIIENMFCKTLVLVKKLPWDIMEEFGFENMKHFIYFDDVNQLPELVAECESNWSFCEDIVNNAYNFVNNNNTVEAVYNTFLKPYDI